MNNEEWDGQSVTRRKERKEWKESLFSSRLISGCSVLPHRNGRQVIQKILQNNILQCHILIQCRPARHRPGCTSCRPEQWKPRPTHSCVSPASSPNREECMRQPPRCPPHLTLPITHDTRTLPHAGAWPSTTTWLMARIAVAEADNTVTWILHGCLRKTKRLSAGRWRGGNTSPPPASLMPQQPE